MKYCNSPCFDEARRVLALLLVRVALGAPPVEQILATLRPVDQYNHAERVSVQAMHREGSELSDAA